MKLMTTLATLTLSLASAAAFAQAASSPAGTPGIDKRQARQEQRIDQGVASGQLNKRETHRLEREQAAINRTENKAKADGTVTPQERKKIHLMQDRASKDIHHQKHDAQHKPGAGASGAGASATGKP
jgi:opacity protein-like surface antigen